MTFTALSYDGPLGSRPIWRVIPGYEKYEASSEGQVRRSAPGRGTTVGRILSPWWAGGSSGSNYAYVWASGPGRPREKVAVHVLVCSAFHGPRPRGYDCDHVDGNPANNHADNLAWVPRQVNLWKSQGRDRPLDLE